MQSANAMQSRPIQMRTINVAPYGINTKNKSEGIYYELAELLSLKSEMKTDHYIYPYSRIIHEMKYGLSDVTIMFKYDELNEYVDYLIPLPSIKNVIVGLNGNHFSSIKELKGKTIAYLRGAKFSAEIDHDKDIHKYLTSNLVNGIKMLVVGRVDAIIGPYQAILYAAKIAGKRKNLLGSPLVVSERTPWLQISKKSKFRGKSEKLSLTFNSLLENGHFLEILKKYN
jgi:polar amino acid transport system substrate-binding protein